MIPIKQITSLPSLEWSPIAQIEMEENGFAFLDKTDVMWQVGDVAVCGFTWHTFFQPPWMWFALARGVTMRHLIDFRRIAKQIPHHTLTAVREDNEIAHRFATFYGFVPLGNQLVTDKASYTLYRKEH